MRKYSLLLACCFLFGCAAAQSFVKTIPKPARGQGMFFDSVVLTRDEMRPVVEISAYGFPGNVLLTGGGFSFQHLRFIKDRWKVIWSISVINWFDLKKVYQGLTFGFLNNLILIGVAAHDKEFIGTLGIGVNLNN